MIKRRESPTNATLDNSPKRKNQDSSIALGYTVVKRNGALVPFHKERIYLAIEAAFRDTRKVGKEGALAEDLAKQSKK